LPHPTIIVLDSHLSHLLLNPTPGEPVHVVGGQLLRPLQGGTLPFRYHSSPHASYLPLLDALFGPCTPSGLGEPSAAIFPISLTHPSETVYAIRKSSGALWRSADTVCNTLNIWNPSDLALFPSLVRGVSDYIVHADDDYAHAAAARPGIFRKRNAAFAASAAHALPKPGEWWDMDISPPYPLDPEGNCRTFFFFERHFAYPFLAFRPSKSAEDFTASVDLLREFIRLICPGISLKRLCGDYDPTWVVAGRPDSILNAHVSAHAHKIRQKTSSRRPPRTIP